MRQVLVSASQDSTKHIANFARTCTLFSQNHAGVCFSDMQQLNGWLFDLTCAERTQTGPKHRLSHVSNLSTPASTASQQLGEPYRLGPLHTTQLSAPTAAAAATQPRSSHKGCPTAAQAAAAAIDTAAPAATVAGLAQRKVTRWAASTHTYI
jgi:hypothetical protein